MDLPASFDSNLVLWSALVAQIMPPLIALINRAWWPSELKAGVAFVATLAAAAGVAYFQGNVTGDVVTSFLIIFTLATVMYRQFWKPSGITPMLEEAV